MSPASSRIHIPEGTELSVIVSERISSKTSAEGDRFTITLKDDVQLADGTVISAGYKGVGEVTYAEKSGMFGQPGALNVKFDYLKIGDMRVPLRGTKGSEGKSSVGSAVAVTALVGIGGFFVHGHNVDLKPAQVMTAFVDRDTDVARPLAPPPRADD